MVEAGAVALVLALAVSAYVVVGTALGLRLRTPELVASARNGLLATPLLLGFATSALIYAFVVRDFSVRYVAENSNRAMPQVYTWVAFYAGNAGSMLFLALVLSLMAGAAVLTLRRRLPYTAPYATAIMGLVLTFLLGVLVFMANPLERLPVAPPDGRGINPLLVHMGMFIHPPVQMTGLMSVAIPFSIAIGALLAGRGGRDQWIEVGRTWGLVSWLILTLGLLMGSWWAYTILGWGGYWAWDPVENSALMPWLAMTAFVHSVTVQRRRGMFRMWNMVLIIVAFTLAELGMFINRGGPVPSVHSFAQSAMGWMFLMFMTFTLLGSLAVFFWKMETLKSREGLDSLVSRESAFLAQNVLFLAVAFITLFGTVYPVLSRTAQDLTVTVGAPFFNRVNGPLLLALLALMGVGPLLPWRRASWPALKRVLKWPMVAAAVTVTALIAIGLRSPVAVLALGVCAMAATSIVHEWIVGTRSRHRRGEAWPVAYIRLLLANRPRYGGYVVHLGIVLLATAAIVSSFYSVQRDIVMKPGDTASLGDYTFTYVDVEHGIFPDREEYVATFQVFKGDQYLGLMRPHRTTYESFTVSATRAAIRSTPIEDFYIVPSVFSEDGEAVFRVYVNPLVWWMWVAGPLVALGILVSLYPHREPALSLARLPAGLRVAGA